MQGTVEQVIVGRKAGDDLLVIKVSNTTHLVSTAIVKIIATPDPSSVQHETQAAFKLREKQLGIEMQEKQKRRDNRVIERGARRDAFMKAKAADAPPEE